MYESIDSIARRVGIDPAQGCCAAADCGAQVWIRLEDAEIIDMFPASADPATQFSSIVVSVPLAADEDVPRLPLPPVMRFTGWVALRTKAGVSPALADGGTVEAVASGGMTDLRSAGPALPDAGDAIPAITGIPAKVAQDRAVWITRSHLHVNREGRDRLLRALGRSDLLDEVSAEGPVPAPAIGDAREDRLLILLAAAAVLAAERSGTDKLTLANGTPNRAAIGLALASRCQFATGCKAEAIANDLGRGFKLLTRLNQDK